MALYPDIYNAVNGFLPAGVTPYFGAENLSQNDAPPRIVWVPTAGRFGPAQQRGSGQLDPRALHTDHATVEAHCWGTDSAGAEALKAAFVLALRSALGPNYRPTGYRWTDPALTQLGRECILTFELDIPITDAVPTVATPPIAMPTTVSFGPSHPGP